MPQPRDKPKLCNEHRPQQSDIKNGDNGIDGPENSNPKQHWLFEVNPQTNSAKQVLFHSFMCGEQ
jgi:hypothetical protein